MSQQSDVIDFHIAFGHPVADFPNLHRDTDVRELRMELLNEEFNEYLDAERNNDLIGIADALGDMLYIILGTAAVYGIPLEEVFTEIHRSNMTKLGLDGKPVYDENGKVIKGPLYQKPNIKGVIAITRFWHLWDNEPASVEDERRFARFTGSFEITGEYTSNNEPVAVTFAKSHSRHIDIHPGVKPNTTTFHIQF